MCDEKVIIVISDRTCLHCARPFRTKASSPVSPPPTRMHRNIGLCRLAPPRRPSVHLDSICLLLVFISVEWDFSSDLFTPYAAGYPFPTAPPVDPFARIKVIDCGVTKGCIRWEKNSRFTASLQSELTRSFIPPGLSQPRYCSCRNLQLNMDLLNPVLYLDVL